VSLYLLEYFQTCKNIIECNNFVYIILPPLDIAFIGLDSTNSLRNVRFSRASPVFTSDESGHDLAIVSEAAKRQGECRKQRAGFSRKTEIRGIRCSVNCTSLMNDITEISERMQARIDAIRATCRCCELVSSIVRFPIFARQIVTVNRFRGRLRWPGRRPALPPPMFYFHVLRNEGGNGRTLSREAPPSGKKHELIRKLRRDTVRLAAVGSYDKSSDATRDRCTKLRATSSRMRRATLDD